MTENQQHPELVEAWRRRLEYYTKARSLLEEGRKLLSEGKNSGFESNLQALTLLAIGANLWRETLHRVYPTITHSWDKWNKKHLFYECHLGNGEVYGFEEIST